MPAYRANQLRNKHANSVNLPMQPSTHSIVNVEPSHQEADRVVASAGVLPVPATTTICAPVGSEGSGPDADRAQSVESAVQPKEPARTTATKRSTTRAATVRVQPRTRKGTLKKSTARPIARKGPNSVPPERAIQAAIPRPAQDTPSAQNEGDCLVTDPERTVQTTTLPTEVDHANGTADCDDDGDDGDDSDQAAKTLVSLRGTTIQANDDQPLPTEPSGSTAGESDSGAADPVSESNLEYSCIPRAVARDYRRLLVAAEAHHAINTTDAPPAIGDTARPGHEPENDSLQTHDVVGRTADDRNSRTNTKRPTRAASSARPEKRKRSDVDGDNSTVRGIGVTATPMESENVQENAIRNNKRARPKDIISKTTPSRKSPTTSAPAHTTAPQKRAAQGSKAKRGRSEMESLFDSFKES